MTPPLYQDYSLKPFNTFGIEAKAKFFGTFKSVEELQELLQNPQIKEQPKLILGGGSNLLFTRDFDGIVLKNEIKGVKVMPQNENFSLVEAGGGVKWHDLVLFCIEQNLAGIENLSLIPGTVGAAPLQNIGAYGVELKDVFHSLEAVDTETGEVVEFDKEKCAFGYRESIFKNEAKGKYIVTHVTLQLQHQPTFNTSYGAIQNTLKEMQVEELSLKAVSDAVCQIRSSKLPDPNKIGNAGSFFKNPEINLTLFETLKKRFPEMPGYPVSELSVKVPAGWLIEQCGWKGKTIGHFGVHKDQALVLVNYGGATGEEIRQLAHDIIVSVREKFGIELKPEVNII
ncbi:MAG: UDP-N-acetylmuramate dehydrogenase [Hymenobacteraceae bacterium]|nr:UDP-N-acetylmuramate dehydrogenase [Hymenobacteraceae bacterium]MDX5395311.1 UDP-N-acetylmuramate dehydrogenase [Hymenobacteraceae bacterium]MDX5511347.1 UDP-N-acetylmuramate dehydrogenase [Hymenobacteraceae bacterium]